MGGLLNFHQEVGRPPFEVWTWENDVRADAPQSGFLSWIRYPPLGSGRPADDGTRRGNPQATTELTLHNSNWDTGSGEA